jgi:plasmid stabilization system protein ParE
VKPVSFHPQAQAELTDEALYYAAIAPVLGERFVSAVEAALALASEFPESGPPYRYKTRRVFPRRFPFSVVYVEREADLYVLAIAPFARKPGYWRKRRKALDDRG